MKKLIFMWLVVIASSTMLASIDSADASPLTTFAQARPIGRLHSTAAAPWPWMQAAPTPRLAPRLYPLDETSDAVVIGNTVPGSRLDVFADGRWVASGFARRRAERVFLPRPLDPGARVVAVERSGVVQSYTNAVQVDRNYSTYHFDNFRDGWNQFETVLTTSNVASPSFRSVFTADLDAEMLAQPLIVDHVAMPGLGTHDTLFAVTENDTAYAFDSDTGAPLWTTSLVNPAAGITPVPAKNIGNCRTIVPNVGVTSTPVIDVTTGTMYLDAKIRQVSGGVTTYHHLLHAIDITTGLDKSGSPIDVTAKYAIPGGGSLTFNAQWEHQRAGLLLYHGVVYVGFSSHCDFQGAEAHGWLLGYSADALQQVSVFNGSPNISDGFASIWAGGYAPAADNHGNIFFATGNGLFDGTANFGDSVLRLDATTLRERDFFTPFDQANLDSKDLDLGSGGVMIIPQPFGLAHELVVEAGNGRTIYLMNPANLGGFTLGGPDKVLQSIPNGVGVQFGVEGGPAYFVGANGTPYVFYGGHQDHIKAWALSLTPKPVLSLATQTLARTTGEGGTVPVVSSNRRLAGTGVLWVVFRPQQVGPDHNVVLAAYDANNLAHNLFESVVGVFFNPKGNLFSVPTVIDGRVFVSNGKQIVSYGLH